MVTYTRVDDSYQFNHDGICCGKHNFLKVGGIFSHQLPILCHTIDLLLTIQHGCDLACWHFGPLRLCPNGKSHQNVIRLE